MLEDMDDSIEREEFEALKERLDYLENKVAFLERECDVSYELHEFERKVQHLVRSDDVDIEVQDNQIGGYHARVSDLSVDQLNGIIENLEFHEYDMNWEMTETGTGGIGLEIWTDVY